MLKISFLPAEPKAYTAVLPVYISSPKKPDATVGENAGPQPIDFSAPAYLSVRVKGLGSVPRLTFDTRYIVLPPVPLGIPARATFNILNDGYESLDAKHRLPAEYAKIPITLRYPEGQQINMSKTKLAVEVEFMSPKPLSFSAKLEFADPDGNVYLLPISGTCDNSVLSTNTYLSGNKTSYSLEGDSMVQLKLTSSITEMPNGAHPQTDFLCRWLNYFLFRTPIDNFPEDMVIQSGKPVFEALEFLSGRNPEK